MMDAQEEWKLTLCYSCRTPEGNRRSARRSEDRYPCASSIAEVLALEPSS